MRWKTLKSDQSDLFSHTDTHTEPPHTQNGVWLLVRFPLYTIPKEHNDVVTSALRTSSNAAITFCLSSLSPGFICPASAHPAPLLKHLKNAGGAYQTWPRHPYTKDPIQSSHFPPPLPHIPLFHTRYAEESAERPHLVTVVYPSGQNMLRKVNFLWYYYIVIKYPIVTVNNCND